MQKTGSCDAKSVTLPDLGFVGQAGVLSTEIEVRIGEKFVKIPLDQVIMHPELVID